MKKKLLFIVLLFQHLYSYSQPMFVINGYIREIKNGDSVFLLAPGRQGKMDTLIAKLKDGKFSFKGQLPDGPDFCYMQVGHIPDKNSINGALVLFIGNYSTVTIRGLASAWPEGISVQGSVSHNDYISYKKQIAPLLKQYTKAKGNFDERESELWPKAVKIAGIEAVASFSDLFPINVARAKEVFGQQGDSVFFQKAFADLQQERKELYQKKELILSQIDSINHSFVLHHPHSYYTPLLLLAPSDLTTHQNSYILKEPGSYYVQDIFSNPANMLSDTSAEIRCLYNTLTGKVKASKYGKLLRYTLDSLEALQRSIAIGSQAPDFISMTPEETSLSLYEIIAKGKLTLIDFWASWCKPCRAENPAMKKVYTMFHHRGLNVAGISLDHDAIAWKKAIKEDGLPWYHISDLKGWKSTASGLYGIHSIPQNYLVDAQGKIIAKNLKAEELEKIITEILGH